MTLTARELREKLVLSIMVIICRCSVGLIFGQSARTEIAYIFLNIKAIVRVLSKEIAILILMYRKKTTDVARLCWSMVSFMQFMGQD